MSKCQIASLIKVLATWNLRNAVKQIFNVVLILKTTDRAPARPVADIHAGIAAAEVQEVSEGAINRTTPIEAE